ncbi:MAG: hypothetical protein IT455_05875 [Planctomycetes bacterium]|nr:hypothetical protein [Planctomycetota bacterium]
MSASPIAADAIDRRQLRLADTATMAQDQRDQAGYLLANIRWMVRLRWLAITGIGGALVAANLVAWSFALARPVATAAALAASNLAVWLRYRRPLGLADPAALRRQIALHMHVDLAALALVVHWTGGVGNPFVVFFIFPVATAAILLTTAAALLIASNAFLTFAAMVVCSMVSAHPKRPFDDGSPPTLGLLQHPAYLVGLLVAAASTLYGIVYFIRTIVAQQQRAEQSRLQHERIALSRERLARVGMIAAGVAHSVRNPLHGLLNCIDLVRSSGSAREADETLSLMQEGLSRIEQVTSRLLSLSRETPLQLQRVDLDDLVKATLSLLEVRAQKQGIELRTELGGVTAAWMDPTRIQETLFNVVDNAMAAVRDGGAREARWVLVRTQAIQQPFAGASLEVVDPGVGVDAANLPHVFDPFFSTKPVGEGTGLGLAIAKEVVEAHGGVVQFQSQRNAGTQVRILIPNAAQAPGDGVVA